MKTIFIALFSLFTTAALAQTKLIAFKSHSGNMNNFNIALENDVFNNEGSNFGNPPFRTIYYLDSVVYISRSTAVLVKKEYQYPWGGSKDSAKFIRIQKDTVHNDPIFSKNHLLDSIRHLLKANSFYEYDTKKTVLIGYDNKKSSEKKKDRLNNNKPKEDNVSPIVTTINNGPGNNSPFDTAMLKALAGIFLLAILGGWLSAKFYNLRLQKA